MSRKRDNRKAQRIGKELTDLRNRASYRKGYRVTQGMVADSIGIQQAAISQYEHGKRIPEPEILDKMYEYYGRM